MHFSIKCKSQIKNKNLHLSAGCIFTFMKIKVDKVHVQPLDE